MMGKITFNLKVTFPGYYEISAVIPAMKKKVAGSTDICRQMPS